ncbi:unnamed protein product [Moneuplotes crassus]|uniref:Uncharacterized protein n=1 Tax=Euplotes crassus TaxID=5936 RepID=A0AAD1U972_EUPCR|nr:unnamed protein product [Moneuplotes crassus]
MNFRTSKLSVKNRLKRSREFQKFVNQNISHFRKKGSIKTSDIVKSSLDKEYLSSLLIERKPSKNSKKYGLKNMTLESIGVQSVKSHYKNDSFMNHKSKLSKSGRPSPPKSENRNYQDDHKETDLETIFHEKPLPMIYYPNMSLENDGHERLFNDKKLESVTSSNWNSFVGVIKPPNPREEPYINVSDQKFRENRASTSHVRGKKRFQNSRGRNKGLMIKINENSVIAQSQKPSFSTTMHKNSTNHKAASSVLSNRRMIKLENTYKKLLNETFRHKISTKKALKISKSQQRIPKESKDLDNFYRTMKERKELSVSKAKENNEKFLHEFQSKMKQNYVPKSRNKRSRISNIRFNLTEGEWKNSSFMKNSYLGSQEDTRYSTKPEQRKPSLGWATTAPAKYPIPKTSKKRVNQILNPCINPGDGLMDKYQQFKHQAERKYVIRTKNEVTQIKEGKYQKEMVNYYLNKKTDQINSHFTYCIERILKVQYKGYLRDIEKIGRYQKEISQATAGNRFGRKKIAIEMHRIEKRLQNYKQHAPFHLT